MAYRSQLAILCALLVPQVCDAGMYSFGETTVSYRFGEDHAETVDEPNPDRDVDSPEIPIHVYGPEWCSVCRKIPSTPRYTKHAEPFPDWVNERAKTGGWPVIHYEVNGKWYTRHGWKGEAELDRAIAETKPAAQAPTPYSKIAEGLELAGLKPGQSFVDIGCGDGRALMIAVEQFKALKATGIEIDSSQAAEARRRVSHLGDQVEIIEGDATAMTLPRADVAYVYLYPDVLEALRPQLERFGTVVSYMHQVPGLPMQKRGDFYIWTRANLQARQPIRRTAVWNGRQYSGPVCNSPNCRMCNSIRSQLQRAVYCPTCRR